MARGLLHERSMALLDRDGLRARRRRARGFTLVELAVVVVIVGVLAMVALVAYRKIILSSRVTEAKNMLGAIRIAEEDYRTEQGRYLDAPTLCPTTAGVGTQKVQWDTGSCGTWAGLTVHADGPVMFQYAVYAPAGPVAQPGTVSPALLDMGSYVGQNRPWYVAFARADIDPSGTPGLVTELAVCNLDNGIRSRHEGE